jgi:hypothetical protein
MAKAMKNKKPKKINGLKRHGHVMKLPAPVMCERSREIKSHSTALPAHRHSSLKWGSRY